MSRNTYNLLGVKIDEISLESAEKKIEEYLEFPGKAIIATPNTEFIIRAQNDAEFKEILNSKTKLNLPDSYGVLWAARFLTLKFPENEYLRYITVPATWLVSLVLLPFMPKYYHYPLKEKISGSDFIWSIARIAAKNKAKVFLYGGAPTVAERAALKLQTDVYDLRVAGVYSGDISRPKSEVIEAINHSRADILLVCLGSPLQERWLVENLSKTNCKIGIGLGGTFDFVAQITPRAPLWMRRSGLEWLYRLAIEPKRLRRQLALPKFAWLVLKEKLKQR